MHYAQSKLHKYNVNYTYLIQVIFNKIVLLVKMFYELKSYDFVKF